MIGATRTESMEPFAHQLAARMGELHVTRRRLAGEAAVALAVVRAALRGDRTVGLDRVDRLATAVGRPAWRLLMRHGVAFAWREQGAGSREQPVASVDSLRCAVRRGLKEREPEGDLDRPSQGIRLSSAKMASIYQAICAMPGGIVDLEACE